jgi:hypothetical protein
MAHAGLRPASPIREPGLQCEDYRLAYVIVFDVRFEQCGGSLPLQVSNTGVY